MSVAGCCCDKLDIFSYQDATHPISINIWPVVSANLAINSYNCMPSFNFKFCVTLIANSIIKRAHLDFVVFAGTGIIHRLEKRVLSLLFFIVDIAASEKPRIFVNPRLQLNFSNNPLASPEYIHEKNSRFSGQTAD